MRDAAPIVRHVRHAVRHPVRHETRVCIGLCGMCGIRSKGCARTHAYPRTRPRACLSMHAAHATHDAQPKRGAGFMPHGMAHQSPVMAHARSRAPIHSILLRSKGRVVEVVR